MKEFVFFGSLFEIPDERIRLYKWGQRVKVDDRIAALLQKDGAPVIPAAEFDAIGFTPEEIERYGHHINGGSARTESHAAADAKFAALYKAWAVWKSAVTVSGV